MSDFSLLVRKKCNALDSEQKRMFSDEYNRRKKSVGTAYLLWVLGWHYAYLRKWGLLALFLFSAFGFFIWWIIDLFRITSLVNEYNNNLALDILRDITMMFGNNSAVLENKLEVENKENVELQKANYQRNYGNSIYSTTNRKSDGEYRYVLILVLLIVFVSVSAYTKPTKVKMENYIINKFLETQPKFLKMFKDFFFGEEITEEKAENFIYNAFKNMGYKDISIEEADFIILKKLKFKDETSQKNLLVAYGFWGMTLIDVKTDNLEIDFRRRNASQNNNSHNQYYTPKSSYQEPSYENDDYYQKIESSEDDIEGDSIKIN